MIKSVMLVAAGLALVACSSSPRVFENMSDLEILQYNQSVSLEERVFCTDEIATGSHIRRRSCSTLAELVEYNDKQIGKIYALSTQATFR